MKNFKPSLIKAAMISSGLAFGASPAVMAQEAPNDAEAEGDVEVIQVSGIRGSLMRAQALKMDNTSIVEVLSAEDIGKLPDTSVAESLARLPGLAGERRNGRTSGLSVRGFNENYVGTSLNGRELLGMGDNRGVEYDLYPTEIIQNIVVYKTPEAGLMAQGIGGTVDLQTVSPIGQDRSITINGTYEKNAEDSGNPDYDNHGHRLSLNYVDSLADDTVGVALTIASMESPRQEKQFRGWGYSNINPPAANGTVAPGVQLSDTTFILDGHDSFTRSALLERTSIAGVLEYAPSDRLSVKLDALYIDFEENDARRGIEEAMANNWGGVPYTITGVENGLVTSGHYDGFHSVVRNDVRQQKSELTTFGLNVEYDINDEWTAVFDASHGEIDKTITDVESYSGVGRAGTPGRPLSARSWTMTDTGVMFGAHPTIPLVDFTDESIIRLAGPQGWGSPLLPYETNADGIGPGQAQDGFVNKPIFDEELTSLRFDVKGDIEWGIFSQFSAGINYSDRSKSKENIGLYLTANTFPGDGPIPEVLGVADLSFIGIEGILAYDSLALYNAGVYSEYSAGLVQTDRFGDTYQVDEEVTTVYSKLDIDTEWGDVYVRGNLGVQIINVDQQASGFDSTAGEGGFVRAIPVTDGDDYTDVLPTINLSFEIAENQFIRTSWAKVMSRPRMDQMKPNNQVSFNNNPGNVLEDTVPAQGPWSGNSGNAKLKPLEANQFDISYENYFSEDGYFALSYFKKNLLNWHRGGAVVVDFSGNYIPGFHADADGNAPVLFDGVVTFTEDGLVGDVEGYEIQGTLPGSIIHDSLEGFGVFGSATFIKGNFDDGSDIPGLSDESYSLTVFYESNGWEFRVSGTKRESFATETRGLSLSLQNTQDRGGELVDAQIGYDFSESGIEELEGLRVTLQGQNLTDEDTIQAEPVDGRLVTLYQTFGANYMLSFNYEF